MTPFYKLSGSGNDFIALVEATEPLPPELIRAWCRRGISLGADGVFTLRRIPQGVAMDYYNSDGLAADLCLNGTRCAAQLAFQLGWGEGGLEVVTPAGPIEAHSSGLGAVTLEIPSAALEPRPLSVPVGAELHAGHRVRVGVPHFVLPWERGLRAAPVRELGEAIRRHPLFAPAGTNVNFVRFPSRHALGLRTFERGVEDETLSCGSGIIASVATGLALGALELPVEVETQSGFVLLVEAGRDGFWRFTGDARIVARGELTPEAAIRVRTPSWLEAS
jgi:diaminopimelate epimerase